MKVCRGIELCFHLLSALALNGLTVHFHALGTLLQDRIPVAFNRKLGGPESHSGRFGEDKNLLSHQDSNCRFSSLCSLVRLLTELSWLLNEKSLQ